MTDHTSGSSESDSFYAGFTDPTDALIERLAAERPVSGDMAAVLADAAEWWETYLQQRAERRERDAGQARRAARKASAPDEAARLGPLSPESAALLPTPKTEPSGTAREDRIAARKYWQGLDQSGRRDRVLRAARAELDAIRRERQNIADNATWKRRNRADAQRWTAEAAAAASRRSDPWGQHAKDRRRERARHWVAISEDRALAIAIAALERAAQQPPQGRD